MRKREGRMIDAGIQWKGRKQAWEVSGRKEELVGLRVELQDGVPGVEMT